MPFEPRKHLLDPHREAPNDPRYSERVKPQWEPDRITPSIAAGLLGPIIPWAAMFAVGYWLISKHVVAYPGADSREIARDLPNHLYLPIPLMWIFVLMGVLYIFFAAAAASGSKVGNLAKRLGMLDTMPSGKLMGLALAAIPGLQLLGVLASLGVTSEERTFWQWVANGVGLATTSQWWLLLAIVVLLPALGEEFFYRGYVLGGLLRRWPGWLAIALTAFFSAGALADVQYALLMLPSALFFGWIAWRWGSIWPAVVVHMAFNAYVFLLLRSPAIRTTVADGGWVWWHLALGVLGIAGLVMLAMAVVREEWKRE